ncbi:TIR domain-containing protein [Mucilaginibacter lappiensis]|uniref:TIR domain-containing protein n=1 Tax=Mucilaginibacter lappiensis TaxID=354630 RepID=UPI003D1C5533
MADPRAFISFDFDNNDKQKNYFVGQTINSRTPFNIQDWSSKEELVQSRWQEIIAQKMRYCQLMIVLVGRSASATGIHREIEMAQASNIPFFGVYVDGADIFTPLPPGLSRNSTINWNWQAISDKIDRCMKDGKNG